MIESQALVIVMAGGFIAAAGQILHSVGPEVFLGTLAIILFAVLGLAAALRADLAPSAELATAAPVVMVKSQLPVSSMAALAPARIDAKDGAFRLTRRPDGRRRDKPCPASPSQIYRPAYVLLPGRVVQTASVTRLPVSRGLALFVERRAPARRVRVRAS